MATKRTSNPRDAAAGHVDDLLRGKLIDIRDAAMEFSAIIEFGKLDVVAADPLWRFAQRVIEEAEALLPKAHESGIAPREREMTDELENSLYARCESCCKGLEHDESHCGAPTARRLLVAIGRIKEKTA